VSDLSSAIRLKREREGLTLRQAGEASGVAFSTLGRIENGAEPSLKVDRAIRAWLDGSTPTMPAPPMDLRDYFAGEALPRCIDAVVASSRMTLVNGPSSAAKTAASIAYIMADAMLAERSKA
jgi:transcriptional regulator with XRE-family HTH domain